MAFSEFYETADSKCQKELRPTLNLIDHNESHLPNDASSLICNIIMSINTDSINHHIKKMTKHLFYVVFNILNKSFLYHDNCLRFW